jgi:hypothetical protein
MIDEAELPCGHQFGQRRPGRQLKLPAERAQEIDEGINADRAVPDHHPVAFGRRASRLTTRYGRIGHMSLLGRCRACIDAK